MIRKPPTTSRRESAGGVDLRAMATGGVTIARAGSYYLRGLICWGFALLWGCAALGAGAAGDVVTFIGVGTMAAAMGWIGRRIIVKAQTLRST
jgi:hypothetical protein